MQPDAESCDGPTPLASDETSSPSDGLTVITAGQRPQAPRTPPRNFLDRQEQRRLFWSVMPPALVLLLGGLWLERAFFSDPQEPPLPQIDTRLLGGPRGSAGDGTEDAVVIEADPAPLDDARGHRGASPEALAKVRDDTVFRDSDKDAWFAIWDTLRDSDPQALARLAGPQVGFTELFTQPRIFRGKPVRFRGTLRRLQQVDAGSNTLGIENYWQGWVDPEGGPPSPIVVYFLTVPESLQPGMRLVEPVEVVGYFLKRWAYQATDTIRTAPLVMSREPTILLPPKPPAPTNLVAVFLWTGGILAVIGFFILARNRLAARAAPVAMLALALSSQPEACGFAEGSTLPPGSAPLTAASYLDRFALAAQDRAAEGPLTQWNEGRLDIGLRILARLTAAPPEMVAAWAGEAIPPDRPPAAEDASESDRPIRVVGRAVRVRDLSLPEHLQERHLLKTVPVVSLLDSDGVSVDVIAHNVPQAWPRDTDINEPADAVGILLARQAGPLQKTNAGSSSDTAKPPPAITLVSARVAWRPGTPLGALGMDYGLFDTVRDGRKLTPEDSDAFYGMLAAAGRAKASSIEAAAGNATDILQLIDPQVRWLETHRGDAVRIRGTARRAIRVAIDDPFRQQQLGTNHYWELYVFVPTPTAVQVNGRLQNTYPVVCCVRELPPNMPHGERIAEEVDLAGFALKRYRYPIATSSDAGNQQESPLVIGRGLRWLPSTEPKAAQQLEQTLGGLLIVVILLLVAAAWLTSGRHRRRRRAAP